ncbi:TIGR02186 family protein [Aureimonas sp. N4]|uniref:TIGR02186 family protein n=1 Tax=Aureimonas sp. N4 TaxID=1638165 RepID=UPI000784DAEB|nr:TIGR02186 family protein [Aureimonas sp. N4]
MRGRALLFALSLLVAPLGAVAQSAPAPSDPPPVPESFQIGLSTETIAVGASSGGQRLVVFGALDNADPRVMRQGRYDIVVILEGPRSNLVVREKKRTFGIWINRGSERFEAVPASYALASTRPIRDIAPAVTLRQLGIGTRNQAFERTPPTKGQRSDTQQYADALFRLKTESGLYSETSGAIEFVSATLFRANLALPADLPVGRHVARAILFREGSFVRERSEDLWVVKTGIENQISVFAARNGALYGLVAVMVAVFTGWFGRLMFKRD